MQEHEICLQRQVFLKKCGIYVKMGIIIHSDASYTAKLCSEMLWINVQRVYHNQGGTI